MSKNLFKNKLQLIHVKIYHIHITDSNKKRLQYPKKHVCIIIAQEKSQLDKIVQFLLTLTSHLHKYSKNNKYFILNNDNIC